MITRRRFFRDLLSLPIVPVIVTNNKLEGLTDNKLEGLTEVKTLRVKSIKLDELSVVAKYTVDCGVSKSRIPNEK